MSRADPSLSCSGSQLNLITLRFRGEENKRTSTLSACLPSYSDRQAQRRKSLTENGIDRNP